MIRVMNYGFLHCTVPSLGVSAIASYLSQHILILILIIYYSIFRKATFLYLIVTLL